MSYRTFKRVLGETNLERKCRWWFGISLFVMLTLSFTWYGRKTDELVENNIKSLSKEYVRAGWQTLHIKSLSSVESQGQEQSATGFDFYQEVAQSGEELGKGFDWDAILPPPPPGRPPLPPENRPRRLGDIDEEKLLAEWSATKPPATPNGDEAP